MTFCGMRAQFGDGNVTYRLQNQRPKVFVQDALPGISRDNLTQIFLDAFGKWAAVCDVVCVPVGDAASAQFVVIGHQFDGPSGILADAEFPAPGMAQQTVRIDVAERWGVNLNLTTVLCHEIGHLLGIPHFDPSVPPPELLNPVYNAAIDKPQSGDISFAQKLYGLPQTQTPSTPAMPLGDSLGVDVIITQNGVRYRAQGTAKRQ